MFNDDKLQVIGECSAGARGSSTCVVGLISDFDCIIDGGDKVKECKMEGFLQ